MRVCKICKEEKSAESFYNNKNTKDGLSPYCKPCDLSRRKQNRVNNLERDTVRESTWRKLNRERCNSVKKNYISNNLDKVRKRSREYRYSRAKHDHLFKLSGNITVLVRGSFLSRGFNITGISTTSILKCSMLILKEHLEKQFVKGMTWLNYGSKWHIDHIIPLSSFTNITDLYLLNNYQNLQPLFLIDNCHKGSTIPEICKLY